MPIDNGINWEGLTGKPIAEITLDDKLTIMIGKLINIEKRTDCVPKHETYFKILTGVVSCVILPVLVWLIIKAIGG